MLFVPDADRRLQTLFRQCVVIALQCHRRRRQRGHRAVLHGGGLGREHPAVIGTPRKISLHFIRPELFGVNAVVGLRGAVTKVRVLPQRRLVDHRERVAHRLDLRQHLHGAVLDVLQHVGNAVRTVHFHEARLPVHRQLVVIQLELAAGERQILDHQELAPCLDVEIARIVPAAHIQPGDVFAGFVRRVQFRPHRPAIEMLPVGRRLARIVQMGNAVPEPVALAYRDVVHRSRQVTRERELPGVAVDVAGNPEHAGALPAIFDHIQARLFHAREIKFPVDVTQPGLRRGHRRFNNGLVLAVLHQAQHPGGGGRPVAGIQLDDGHFRSIRMVADLVVSHHRRTHPIGNHVRADVPHHHFAGLSRRDQRAHHEPAVLRHHTAVVKRQRPRLRDDLHAVLRLVHSERDTRARREGQRLPVPFVPVPFLLIRQLPRLARRRRYAHRRIARADRKQPRRSPVRHVCLSRIHCRQKLQIETGPPGEPLRQRLVEDHRHPHALRLGTHFQPVREVILRIAGVRGEAPVLFVRILAFQPRDRIPLFRRGQQPHVAVGGNAPPVKDHFHRRVLLVEEHPVERAVVEDDAEPLRIQVTALSHLHRDAGAAEGRRAQKNEEEGRQSAGHGGIIIL